MKRIEENVELMRNNTVDVVAVYLGGMAELANVTDMLPWRLDNSYCTVFGFPAELIKFSEIVEYLGKNKIITVINSGPLICEVYQYGNYGDEWYKLGEIAGYA